MSSYDILIIGSGPGGYVAAIRAAQLGLKTGLVERSHLGGICLNWGCIPTKALLRSAEIYHNIQHSQDYGINVSKAKIDLSKMVERSRGVSARLNGGVEFLLKKNKVDVIWGEAHIDGVGKVSVKKSDVTAPKNAKGEGNYTAKHIIIATGARPRPLSGADIDGKNILSYFEAMVPNSVPKSLTIIGSGAIGIEFASFYSTLGCKVQVVEMADEILPAEDIEIATHARKQFEKQGIEFFTKAKLSKVENGKKSVKSHIELGGKKQVLESEKLILAIGVIPNSENLGLESLGVKMNKGVIETDDYSSTNVKGIYAIGDITGAPMLAHKAEHEGVICVEKISGSSPHVMDRSKIPGCTYCHPQISSVGLTEQAAKEKGLKIKVGKFSFGGNGKAIALGESEGLVKTIFDATTGQLLGAHLVGAEVTELISTFVVAMNLETTEQELIHSIFPHPTLSEMLHESVLDSEGRVIHG